MGLQPGHSRPTGQVTRGHVICSNAWCIVGAQASGWHWVVDRLKGDMLACGIEQFCSSSLLITLKAVSVPSVSDVLSCNKIEFF